jgi:hypothetical protein
MWKVVAAALVYPVFASGQDSVTQQASAQRLDEWRRRLPALADSYESNRADVHRKLDQEASKVSAQNSSGRAASVDQGLSRPEDTVPREDIRLGTAGMRRVAELRAADDSSAATLVVAWRSASWEDILAAVRARRAFLRLRLEQSDSAVAGFERMRRTFSERASRRRADDKPGDAPQRRQMARTDAQSDERRAALASANKSLYQTWARLMREELDLLEKETAAMPGRGSP